MNQNLIRLVSSCEVEKFPAQVVAFCCFKKVLLVRILPGAWMSVSCE